MNFNFNAFVGEGEAAPEVTRPNGLRFSSFAVPLLEAKIPFDLHLWLFQHEGGIWLRLLGNARLFRQETCADLLRRYVDLLTEASKNPHLQI